MCRYLGPDYGDERKGPQGVVSAAQLPLLAKQSFPLCMQSMYHRLHQDSHLKHYGRLQLGLFLKARGQAPFNASTLPLRHVPSSAVTMTSVLVRMLQGVGLPLEEAMKFWRAEFGPKCAGEVSLTLPHCIAFVQERHCPGMTACQYACKRGCSAELFNHRKFACTAPCVRGVAAGV